MATWWLSRTAQGEAAEPDEESARRRLLPGRKPFIVPPSATKSAFYDNPVTVQLWQSARRALERQSVRVGLLGYSLPLTDLVTASLLRQTLVEMRRPVSVGVQVANTDCGTVGMHLKGLGIAEDQVTRFDSVEAYAFAYVRSAAEELASAFAAWEPKEEDSAYPIAVGRSVEHSYAVDQVRASTDGECELLLTPYPRWRPFSPVGQPRTAWSQDSPAPITVGELKALHPVTPRFVAVSPDGHRTNIVGAAATPHEPRAGTPGWQILITAEEIPAAPPSDAA